MEHGYVSFLFGGNVIGRMGEAVGYKYGEGWRSL